MAANHTDVEEWESFLQKYDIPYKWENYSTVKKTLSIYTDKKKVQGYSGFCIDVDFTMDGKYIEMGIWE